MPLSIGTHEIETTITCLKEFDKDQYIKVIVTYKNVKGELVKSLAGKLQIIKNKIRHKVEVLFVNIWSNLSNTPSVNKAQTANRDTELKKYLNQGLVNPIIETVTLDLSIDTDPITNIITNRKTNFINKSQASGGIIPDGSLDDIYLFLNEELYKDYDKTKYEKYFKVYFINENADNLYGIGRSMDDDKTTPSIDEGKLKTILVYAAGFADSTVAHEALHSMGLYHTFDNDGDFTFEYCKTDNIMDYSDIGSPPIPVISLYHWQWYKIWKKTTRDI